MRGAKLRVRQVKSQQKIFRGINDISLNLILVFQMYITCRHITGYKQPLHVPRTLIGGSQR